MIRHSGLLLLPGPPHCHSPLLNVAHSARAQSRKVDQAGPAWEWLNWEAWCVWILKPNRPTPFIHIFVSCVSCFVSNHPIFWVVYHSIFAECILASHIQEQMTPGFRYLNEESRWVGAFQLPFRFLRICWLFKAALIHRVAPSAQMERSSKTVEETSLCMPRWNVNWYCLILLLHKTEIKKGCLIANGPIIEGCLIANKPCAAEDCKSYLKPPLPRNPLPNASVSFISRSHR